jgi:FMNH2-dependent dimethyl sulfone monooxygenase
MSEGTERAMGSMQDRIAMYNNNKLKLGLFGANCSNGRAMTRLPERWPADWDSCQQLAELADAAGADLVGHGRFGLNVVVGWNDDEFQMFGEQQRDPPARYEYGQEWIDAVKRMWGPEEEFDFNGKYLKLRSVRSKPKPYGGTRPLIMNAGVSQTGRAYALRNCDALFTAVRFSTLEQAAREVTELKAAGRAFGRDIGVYTVGEIVCRPTRAQAQEYFRHWTEEAADWGAVDYMLQLKGVRRESDPDRYDRMRKALVHGQSGFPMIGSPDDVAQELARISCAGFDGIGFSFVNYLDELPYFAQEVLPRLQKLGVRESRD